MPRPTKYGTHALSRACCAQHVAIVLIMIACMLCSCYNRHYAEHSGYFLRTPFEEYMRAHGESPVVFYDSVTGLPLYVAPVGRSVEDFLKESRAHGWPSFRDQECVWENVRLLKNGEAVSSAGTHLVRCQSIAHPHTPSPSLTLTCTQPSLRPERSQAYPRSYPYCMDSPLAPRLRRGTIFPIARAIVTASTW